MQQVYDMTNRVLQRLWWGASTFHPMQMAAMELLELYEFADKQQHNANKEFQKFLQLQKMATDKLGKIPQFSAPNWSTAINIIGHQSREQLKGKENEILKQLGELAENYEKVTLQLLEEVKKQAEAVDGGKELAGLISKLIFEVKHELEEIKMDREFLEKLDVEKLKKGDTKMNPYNPYHPSTPEHHEHEAEMRRRYRRHRMDYATQNAPYSPHMDYSHTSNPYGLLPFMYDERHEDFENPHHAEMYRRRHYRRHY